jgi:hypothetical protein
MRRRKRLFFNGILNHCYQRTIGGEVLFYSVSDYLVFFTIVSVVARKYHVRILGMAPMPDHIHMAVIASRKGDFDAFMHDYTLLFALENNKTCHRIGPLFERPYGSAPKSGDKKARSCLIYIGNNPPERRLCTQPEQYRWSFLAYAQSSHPFSAPLVIRKASWPMKKAVKIVLDQFKNLRPLPYTLLQQLFSSLSIPEKEQLTDFIISTYNVIDYDAAIRFFDNYDDMIKSMHATTGSEHDLNEVFIGKSDAHYARMTSILLKELGLQDIHDIFLRDEQQRWELFLLLRKNTDAMGEQIAKYLRIKLRREDTHRKMETIE